MIGAITIIMLLSVPIAMTGMVLSIANGNDSNKLKGNDMVKRYKTKPCEIEAIQWNGDNVKEVLEFITWKNAIILNDDLFINTLEGKMKANIGDYIIKGLRGEFYPCKPDVFHKKYEMI